MKQEKDRDRFVEQVLGSLDGLERAQPQSWFYTRLLGRLQKEERTGWERVSQLLARPVVAMASLCLVLVLNAYLLLQSGQQPANTMAQGEPVVESESLIASSSSFDYENITP